MLIDTSALLRTLQPGHPQREVVRSAIKILSGQGNELYIVPRTSSNYGSWRRGLLNRTVWAWRLPPQRSN